MFQQIAVGIAGSIFSGIMGGGKGGTSASTAKAGVLQKPFEPIKFKKAAAPKFAPNVRSSTSKTQAGPVGATPALKSASPNDRELAFWARLFGGSEGINLGSKSANIGLRA